MTGIVKLANSEDIVLSHSRARVLAYAVHRMLLSTVDGYYGIFEGLTMYVEG